MTIYDSKPDQKRCGPTRLCVRCRRHAKALKSAQKIWYGKRMQWLCVECIEWLQDDNRLYGAGPKSVGGRKKQPTDAKKSK